MMRSRRCSTARPPTALAAPHPTGGLPAHEPIGVAAVSQLVDAAQTQAIAHALDRLAELMEQAGPADRSQPHHPPLTIDDAITALFDRLDAEGLGALSPHRGHPGHLA